MKKRFTEEQIIGVLKEAEQGPRLPNCAASTGSRSHLRNTTGGEVRRYDRFGRPATEGAGARNNKLKLLAESMLDKAALQDLLSRK